jgi:hypothetical protein
MAAIVGSPPSVIRRQRLAVSGNHHAAGQSHRPRGHLRLSEGSGERNAARFGRHSEHEKRIAAADPNWPDWYAAYMVAEQAGTELAK